MNNNEREAIVLAGGFGTRLRELVPSLPKPMAPVAGKPFLEILLRLLAEKGFSRVILSLGFMASKISNYFGSNFAGLEVDYVIEDKPLGTGGAVRLAMTRCNQDCVFIFNGDTFIDLEVTVIHDAWLKNNNPIIVARHVTDVTRYGCIRTQNGLINAFDEKGVSGPGLINAGCYVFHRQQLANFSAYQPFSLESDFLAKAVKKIPVEVFITQGLFIDIGIPQDYQFAQVLLANR